MNNKNTGIKKLMIYIADVKHAAVVLEFGEADKKKKTIVKP